jgi:hypothetical protein
MEGRVNSPTTRCGGAPESEACLWECVMPREVDETSSRPHSPHRGNPAARETEPDVPATADGTPLAAQNAAPRGSRSVRSGRARDSAFRRAPSGEARAAPAARGLFDRRTSRCRRQMPSPTAAREREQPEASMAMAARACWAASKNSRASSMRSTATSRHWPPASPSRRPPPRRAQPLRLANAGAPGSRAGAPAEPPEHR